jgi:hypothetical protein
VEQEVLGQMYSVDGMRGFDTSLGRLERVAGGYRYPILVSPREHLVRR